MQMKKLLEPAVCSVCVCMCVCVCVCVCGVYVLLYNLESYIM